MELFYITNNPEEAKVAENAGVDRIFIDTEILGKAERQKGLDTHLGNHSLEDVRIIRNHITKSEIMVRINPLNRDTRYEIEKAADNGADWIMLPMFTHPEEVAEVANIIDKKAKFVALVETAAAMSRLDRIIEIPGLDEVHIGLNDLSLCLGLNFLFEPLSCGLIDVMSEKLNRSKIKWGFGGIARVGGGTIPCEMILAEHYRLGSERAILSRAFRRQLGESIFDLSLEVSRVRDMVKKVQSMTTEQLESNRLNISNKIFHAADQARKGII